MDTEGNASDLAEYVRARMEALGWSLRRTAEEARISTGALSKMLNKRAEPTPETLTKLAKALQVDPTRLYRLAGIPMPTPRNQRDSRVEYLAQRIDAMLKHLRPHFQNALIESVGGIVDAWEDMVSRAPELYIEEQPAPATPAIIEAEPVQDEEDELDQAAVALITAFSTEGQYRENLTAARLLVEILRGDPRGREIVNRWVRRRLGAQMHEAENPTEGQGHS